MKVKARAHVTNGIVIAIMSLVSVTMLFPFLWMLTTSFKIKRQAIRFPIEWLPNPLTFKAYKDIWEVVPLLNSMLNSLMIAAPVLITGTFVSALAAFAFSKMEMPHKNALFMGLLATMMIPGAVTMIPQYVVWGKLGLVDTFIPLIVPGMLGNVTMMFFFRQFLNGIPSEFIDAAKIDGASWMTTFNRIFLPIMKPAIAAQVIFWFMGIWNDFMGPLIYLDSESKYTVQLALRTLSAMSESTNEYPLIMAGSVISTLPLLLIFICFQQYFMESMAISGVKG